MNLKTTFITLTTIALVGQVSAKWCGCYLKDGDDGFAFIGRADLWNEKYSKECCQSVTGRGLMDGGFWGLSITGKDWCDAGDEDAWDHCCEGKSAGPSTILGYCK